MIVMVGETRDSAYLERMRAHGWGRIWVRSRPVQYPGEPWAFDNGAYGQFLKGQRMDEDLFVRRLDAATTHCAQPYMAVLPDVVASGYRSMVYSERWLKTLEDHPWKSWYFVVQDGMTAQEVGARITDIPLGKMKTDYRQLRGHVHPSVAGIFLGGSNNFKRTAYYWSYWAHTLGLRFHYGRASTPARIRAARRSNADSMDTSFPLWTRERFQRFVEMWTLPDPQPELGCM